MALCDQLEAAKTEREQSRDRLVAASLHLLNSPADAEKDNTPEAFRNHARFVFNHLPRLTTRPEHIKQLRQTILTLALQGYLSKRIDSDGHASELIDRITQDSSKKRKSVKNEPNESGETLPNLPESWVWVTVNEVAAHTDNAITDGPFGANLKTSHYVETPGYRVIRLQNIGHGRFRDEYHSYISREHFQRLAKHHVEPGDLVVAGLVDPLVRCCEVPQGIGPALVKADCYRFSVHPEVCSRFALHYLNSPICQDFAAVHHHGMTLLRIGLGNFRQIPFPLPPLAEQHRIVAKVDELMAVCDQLEAQLTITEADSRRLLEAVLHEALNGCIPVT